VSRISHLLRDGFNSGGVRFAYRGFYDVPQGLITTYNGRKYLFERLFDDNFDDYQNFYSVYDIGDIEVGDGESIWTKLEDSRRRFIYTIPVKDIQFDSTKRKSIHASAFEKLARS
jgi:hypothetical protein